MRMKPTVIMLAVPICAAALLVGCGSSETETESASVESVQEEESLQIIGNESDDAYDIWMTNETGSVITGLSVKSSEETEYPSNIMRSEQQIEDGETVEFFYLPDDSDAAESKDASGEEAESDEDGQTDGSTDTDSEDLSELADAAVNITYTLQVTTEDGEVFELSYFAMDDMEEVTLCYDDEVAYLEYTSLSEDVEISTKEAELAMKSDRQAAQAVADQIDSVGEVSLDSAEAIQTARAAYDALTDSQKLLVSNADLLTQQESELAALQQAAEEEAAAEAAAQAAEAAAQAASQSSGSSSSGSSSSDSSSSDSNSSDSSSSGSSSSEAGSSDSSSSSQSTEGCLDDVLINQ